jgi:hypothetical protein
MVTTLNRIRAASPCADGWQKLLAGLGKTKADDEPLTLIQILDINGIQDAIWALRAINDCPQIHIPRTRGRPDLRIRLFVAACDELAAAGAAAWDKQAELFRQFFGDSHDA